VEDTFTKNEKSKNEQVASEGNDYHFFYTRGIIMIAWVPESETVSQNYYF
jgi:hypothetical protein